MYYRDNSGCLGVLIIAFFLMVIAAVLFNPYFWLIAGGLFLYSVIRRAIDKRKEEKRMEAEEKKSQQEKQDFTDYSEGTDDPDQIEAAYETDAVDVDVEVTPSPDPEE